MSLRSVSPTTGEVLETFEETPASELERRHGKHSLTAHRIHLPGSCYKAAALWNRKTLTSFRLYSDFVSLHTPLPRLSS